MLMNLVILDIDGTLTQSYDYDKEIMGAAIAGVLAVPTVDADLNGYVDTTSLGVTLEAIERVSGRQPGEKEVEEVKSMVFRSLEKMYRDSPGNFNAVPGASFLLERLRKIDGLGLAIATGCWRREALIKLKASGLDVDGIPMASSDDDRDRQRIMEIAIKRAADFYVCRKFERIIYLGDGPWDFQASRSLGCDFVGIGPRVRTLAKNTGFRWHQDYSRLDEVMASIAATLNGQPSPPVPD
jgi:phosphoglycolate phosphatase-like HAD superfamily hydrolase